MAETIEHIIPLSRLILLRESVREKKRRLLCRVKSYLRAVCRPLQNGDFPLTKKPNTHLNNLRPSEAHFREHILRRQRVTAPLRALKAVPNLHLSGLPKVLRARIKAHLRNPKFRLMNPSLLSRLKRPLRACQNLLARVC